MATSDVRSPSVVSSPKESSRSGWYILALLVAVSLLFRFLLSNVDRVVWGDEPFYLWLGRNWLTGKGYTFTGYSDVHHAPLYPFLTGLLYLVTADLALSSRIWYILFGAALCLPVYGIAREIYDRRAGHLSVLLVTFFPPLAVAVLYWGTLTEPPYYFFVYSGLYAALLALRGKLAPWSYGAAGVLFALAYLTRPEAIAYLAVIGLFLAFIRLLERRLFTRQTLLGLALYLVGFAIFFIPYAVYVHKYTGSWMISEKAGVTFITGLGLSSGDTTAFDKSTWGLDKTGLEVYFFSPESYNVSMLEYIRAHPRDFARLLYQNTVKFVDALFSLRLFPYFLAPLVGLALLREAWSKPRSKAELLLFASLTPVLSFLLFFVQDRYIATLLPTLLIWLAVGLRDSGDWLSGTVQNLRGSPLKRGWSYLLFALPLIAVLAFCLLVAPRTARTTSQGSFRQAHRTAGLALRAQGVPAETIVMSRYPAIAFHADTRWAPTPNAEYEAVMRYARHKGARYFVVDERETKNMRPQLAFLVEGRQVPAELRLVHSETSEGEKLVVYEILDR